MRRRSTVLLALVAIFVSAVTTGCRGAFTDDDLNDTGSGDGDGDGDGDGGGVELLDNGGFEAWLAGKPQGWLWTDTPTHTLTLVEVDCHEGSSCARIDLGWTGEQGEYDQLDQSVGPLPAGTTLVGSVFIREAGLVDTLAVGMLVNVTYAEPDDMGNMYDTLLVTSITAGPEWTEATGSVVIEHDVTSAVVGLIATNGAFDYDAASLRRLDP